MAQTLQNREHLADLSHEVVEMPLMEQLIAQGVPAQEAEKQAHSRAIQARQEFLDRGKEQIVGAMHEAVAMARQYEQPGQFNLEKAAKSYQESASLARQAGDEASMITAMLSEADIHLKSKEHVDTRLTNLPGVVQDLPVVGVGALTLMLGPVSGPAAAVGINFALAKTKAELAVASVITGLSIGAGCYFAGIAGAVVASGLAASVMIPLTIRAMNKLTRIKKMAAEEKAKDKSGRISLKLPGGAEKIQSGKLGIGVLDFIDDHFTPTTDWKLSVPIITEAFKAIQSLVERAEKSDTHAIDVLRGLQPTIAAYRDKFSERAGRKKGWTSSVREVKEALTNWAVELNNLLDRINTVTVTTREEGIVGAMHESAPPKPAAVSMPTTPQKTVESAEDLQDQLFNINGMLIRDGLPLSIDRRARIYSSAAGIFKQAVALYEEAARQYLAAEDKEEAEVCRAQVESLRATAAAIVESSGQDVANLKSLAAYYQATVTVSHAYKLAEAAKAAPAQVASETTPTSGIGTARGQTPEHIEGTDTKGVSPL
ncbi:MAG: hypothetical protein HY589_00405, partial [Candidatus Omnitrophica bacterium]|nr:hypothetical protein [Candidatus Omnitrophota bacterium]